jgi:hypothetical protein
VSDDGIVRCEHCGSGRGFDVTTAGHGHRPKFLCKDCGREHRPAGGREMWDFTKAIFCESEAMRYDTPGDWYGYVIEAWSGLGRVEYIRAMQLHELIEATILRAAGITPDVIDILDNFELIASAYAKGEASQEELLAACVPIPKEVKNIYDRAHVLALLVEREFIEACGLNWKEYDDFIEATRGKIPIRPEK